MNKTISGNPKNYKILQEIAQTSSSCVFKVLRTDKRSNWSSTFALKILKSRKEVQDCISEFESLKRVHSKRCMKVYDWEWFEGFPGLLMEYVEGVSLFQLLKGGVCFSKSEVDYIVNEIYWGLLDLQKCDLIHGDLSPSNVLIDVKGRIRLIDYGMGNTQEGTQKYSPQYSAPEVVARGDYSFAADLYSLGVIGRALGLSERKADLLTHTCIEARTYAVEDNVVEELEGLARKVKKTLYKCGPQDTMRLNRPKPLQRFIYANKVALIFLFSSIFLSSHASNTDQSFSSVSVKTLTWVDVQFLGGVNCFSPCENLRLPAGKVKMTWKRYGASGSRVLTLREGESKVLSEKDFHQE